MSAELEIYLAAARHASRDLDTAALFKRLDPEAHNIAVRKAGEAFDRLIDAVLVERERIYAEKSPI